LAKPSSKEKWDLLKRSEREIKQKSSNLQQLVPQNSINPANRGGAVYNPTHRRLRQAGIKFQVSPGYIVRAGFNKNQQPQSPWN
jgi:hypothetical protein